MIRSVNRSEMTQAWNMDVKKILFQLYRNLLKILKVKNNIYIVRINVHYFIYLLVIFLPRKKENAEK